MKESIKICKMFAEGKHLDNPADAEHDFLAQTARAELEAYNELPWWKKLFYDYIR